MAVTLSQVVRVNKQNHFTRENAMNKYAVAYINFFDNDLKVKVVSAPTWYDALEAAFPGKVEHLGGDLGDGTIEKAKEEAFNQDWLFDVVEVK